MRTPSHNAEHLFQLWRGRASGVLMLGHEGAPSGLVVAPLHLGNLVCHQGEDIVRSAMREELAVSFVEIEVAEQGHALDLGPILLEESRAWGARALDALPAHAILSWGDASSDAWELPLAPATREILERVDGACPMSRLLLESAEGLDQARAELGALLHLGALRASTGRELSFSASLHHAPQDSLDIRGLVNALERNARGCADCPTARPGEACTSGTCLGLAREDLREGQQTRLLAQGRRLLEQGQWLEADRALSAARDLRVDNPQVLAALALARARNPTRELAVRRRDALQLASLASQLDGEDPEVSRLHRQVREELGLPEAPRGRVLPSD